jgi:conjugative relaxase-like TrwC/TraI family protein
MLRVRTIYARSAAASARYYARYLDPDHSLEAPGQWVGRQAEDLGLAGDVGVEDLEAILSGYDPVSGQRLGAPFRDRVTRHGKLIQAVSGLDGTFSAPKSVSIWWGLTGDPGVLAAHNLAVQAVLEHVERYGCTTRVRSNGRRYFPDAQGLTMAVFQQSTSREDDPQLHTHVVISTKVRAPNGAWYALDAHYVKNNQRALGGLYQSVLRAELTARYGVRWGPIIEAQAELADMPPELLEVFSKRTRQVEEYADLLVMAFREQHGRDPTRWERAAIGREAAADSRRTKTGLPVAEAATRWVDEAAALGWTGDRLATHLTGRGAPQRSEVDLEDVLDVVSASSSTWRRIDILRGLCDLARPQPGYDGRTWAATLEDAADRAVGLHTDLDPVHAGPVRASDSRSIWLDPNLAHLSHDRVLAQEDRILSFALAAQQPGPAPSLTVQVEGLDPLQADAARAVAGTDPLVVVVGPAGAGKTTTLARAAQDLHRQGRAVFGVAPTAKAARVLRSATGMEAATVAKLLHEWDRPAGPDPAYRLPRGATVILDETGMTGTGTLGRLVVLAESQQWRLVLVGDPAQLAPVGRGGMFAELCRISEVHELAVIHRFTHRWEQHASLQLRHAHPEVLDLYETHGRIHPGTLDRHLAAIADAWITHHAQDQTVAVMAETNAQVDVLNEAIQARRRDAGHLDDHQAVPVAGSETASPGDVVVTRRNDRTLRDQHGEPVRNRERWHVDAVHADGALTVTRFRGHGTVTLPADYVATQVRLGYASTAHGHQGDTADVAYTLIDQASTHRGVYVGATRGRDENHLLVLTEAPGDLAEARDTLERALTRDRADIPAIAQRRQLAETICGTRPLLIEQLAEAERAVLAARNRAEPYEAAASTARVQLESAEADLANARARVRAARPWARRGQREALTIADRIIHNAREDCARAEAVAAPVRADLRRAIAERDRLNRLASIERQRQRLDQMQQPSIQRQALGR